MNKEMLDPIVVDFYYDPYDRPKSNTLRVLGNCYRSYIYESIYESITNHDLIECYQLLKIVSRCNQLDPYITIRFLLILIESNPTENVDKNFILHLESLLSRFRLGKPDALTGFLCYFIRHNRIEDARDLLRSRHRYMTLRPLTKAPFSDLNIKCYEFLLCYLEWEEKVKQTPKRIAFDYSIQGWLVNIFNSLKKTKENYEYFIFLVSRVLLYHGYHKKAYLIVSEFQRNNPDNLGIQLFFYNLLKYLERIATISADNTNQVLGLDYNDREKYRTSELKNLNNFSFNPKNETFEQNMLPIESDKQSILKNIRRLDNTRDEIQDLHQIDTDPIETFKSLLDGMEIVSEIKNMVRWRDILAIMTVIKSSDANLNRAKNLWQTRYQPYWRFIHFEKMASESITLQDSRLILDVLNLMKHELVD